MKKKILILSAAALVSLSGAPACGAVQDEVQQQAEDEVNKQKTRAEQKLQQEKTKAIDEARTTATGG